jgi:serine/threonine protein kinase
MWQVGDKLGRFRLDREIGQGSHGVVYMATDTALDTPVAVKILHPWLTQDTAVRDRFKRELLLARRIAHPGVCRLFDLHEEGEAFFITMDYVEGQTLLNILKNEGRIHPLRAVKILRGVCQALAAAHNAGVIHRDLKPANIIVRAEDSPMILDFGTATASDVSRVTRPGTAVGSMRFIAPEIFTGVSPSIRTDIYSLGVVAYVTLAGKLPYNAASGALEMLEMIRNQPPQRLDVAQSDVPARLADVIGRAMEKNPDSRFASALAFDEALGEVERQLDVNTAKASQTGDFARWAPASIIRESVGGEANVPPPLGPTQTPITATALPANASGLGGPQEDPAGFEGPETKEVSSEELNVLLNGGDSTRRNPTQSAATIVEKRPMGLTLGAPPTEAGTELPLVTGAQLQEPANTDSGDQSATMFATDPEAEALEAEAGPDATMLEEEDPLAPRETLVRSDVTVRVARIDLEEGLPRRQESDKRVLLIAAAIVGVAIVGGLIALVAGGSEPAEPGTDPPAVAADPDAVAGADSDPSVASAADPSESDPSRPAPKEPEAEPEEKAGEVLDFGDEPEPEPAAQDRRPRPRDRVEEDIRALRVAMLKKGYFPGDVPAAEELLLRAKAKKDEKLVAQAKQTIEKQTVDRAFVLGKLQRFNSQYAKSKRPDIADKVEPLARDAATSFSKGEYERANKKLNEAFLLIGRKAK